MLKSYFHRGKEGKISEKARPPSHMLVAEGEGNGSANIIGNTGLWNTFDLYIT
jgi:hypothetical protein